MNAKNRRNVFIAHGHDQQAITTVAKFVETLGLDVGSSKSIEHGIRLRPTQEVMSQTQ